MKKLLMYELVLCIMVIHNLIAGELKLAGNWDYAIDYNQNTINIIGDAIEYAGPERESGVIKLEVYVTNTRYSGGSITGYVLSECEFNPLEAGYYYDNINKVLDLVPPPTGIYYVALILSEYFYGRYYIVDYLSSDDIFTYLNNYDNSFQYTTPYVTPQIAPDYSGMENNNRYNNEYIRTQIQILERKIEDQRRSISLYESTKDTSSNHMRLLDSARKLLNAYENQKRDWERKLYH